tara:strand:- start:823 stop:1986 length:1164 start_codon:yes stop_codon:yes gene_type:complete
LSEIRLYFHWPWCKKICPYCDFNVKLKTEINEKTWIDSYITELNYFFLKNKFTKIKSIYFGGGTPSLMSIHILERIISYIVKNFSIDDNIEITIETNPSSLTLANLENYKNIGINRISLGIQSFEDTILKFLGRDHTSKDAEINLHNIQKIFSRSSFDIIYGIPGQSIRSWEKNLSKILDHAKTSGHVSLYQLTIEPGTPFYKQNTKKFIMPDDDFLAEMYIATKEATDKSGIHSYEISNYSLKNQESIHNIGYWRYNQFIGIGPGAHSRINFNGSRRAFKQIESPTNWITSVSSRGHGTFSDIQLSNNDIAVEILLTGLRLKEGVNSKTFDVLTKKNLKKLCTNPKLNTLFEKDLVYWKNSYLIASTKGQLVLNSILNQFEKVLID